MQEPGEAANKLLKRWTLSHCRQRGNLHRNIDLMNWFTEMSDPVTLQNMDQNTRHERNRDTTSLTIPPEVIALCKDPAAVDPTEEISLVAETADSESDTDMAD